MEAYEDFLKRVSEFEKPEFGINTQGFTPSKAVMQKVNLYNSFSEFYGDTVVFKLYEYDVSAINRLMDYLYSKAPECFCERLPLSTIHMTLHDLVSFTNGSSIIEQMDDNLKRLTKLKDEHAFDVPGIASGIKMRTNYMINMVDTSIVLCLVPDTPDDYRKLISLYKVIDENVLKLSYPFTPHVTLAYYNRNGFNSYSAFKLQKLVSSLNANKSLTVFLGPLHLVYQRFSAMDSFEDKLILA